MAVLFAGCGVGNYSVSSGSPDEGYVTFVSGSAYTIDVNVDDIKKTAQNTITLKPGTHTLKVSADGKEIYSQKVFISAQETKIIKL